MRDKSFSNLDTNLGSYVGELFQPVTEELAVALEASNRAGLRDIQVGPMDGRHLEVLTRLIGAKRVVEIGTLGGYSGICFLKAMGPEGFLHTFEISETNALVAEKNLDAAGFNGRFKVWKGSALERLKDIEESGPFDIVFIDADKENYPNYLKWAEKHLRKGGVVIGDNTFAFGRLVPSPDRADTPSVLAIREFNRSIAQDGIFCGTIFPTGEGLTVGVKL